MNSPSAKQHIVATCTARQDGGWLIVTLDRSHGVSTEEIPQGSHVIITRDGLAHKPGRGE